MIEIYFWADGTWCYKDEYSISAYGWKSDDIGKLYVSGNASDAEVDSLVKEEIC